ncbi:bifunctional methylenetetrahydrofolate dehydrogenase/methenyltetrahydrofolate cyclohydrolase FolD [Pseudobacillus badius]|uniref:bifunctional methylenetetrahydrofolate dehydrogenase/methenyltetrahydrofolate cyclohydrolase FolD n=1 Tax=Bacillus badius TaxID=1455 RepID=UPI0007B0A4D5|nr:bifunctional methylenetetrahydrofolate dehydrogenase/methenyltetrahydrofolate cyclohydrolase FolD [Bacillus badius]KZN98869.1 bifunctional methylenetetrahydrofolate dehydrogenase/methenyltetrahydrofolate cyclohydrolase [Bacillus badius]OCS83806.1 bifunctional methylenetetrahydrofolate dehydrogenase/methenyltetrahydrofolate cyclohydrolase [Bacillus badius]OVE52903.1 bifunctional methylenetetrahydrofolate dehydrogenase/methenyltetrahydrofolate cyclohydrolase [Bacillus badius]TDW04935.1 methyle
MTAAIIDGKKIASDIRKELKQEIEELQAQGVTPGLAVILVGDDQASHTYVRNKDKACAEVGIHSEIYRYSADLSEEELLQKVEELNADPAIHGILVQLPLPAHLSEDKVIDAISPEKDVDGFHPVNVGKMAIGKPAFYSCTPYGIIKMLERENISLEGKHVVVVGRSNIVGKPAALLSLKESATVTVCHSRTKDLSAFTRQADVVIAAVGKAKFLKKDDFKPGAVVIDVGMNRDENGKLCGDVDFESAKEKAGAITPVPGGVGPMTITMLLYNTVQSAKQTAGRTVK